MNSRTQMLLLKGAISEASKEEQQRIEEIAAKIRELIGESEEGMVALTLIGLEFQMKAES